MLKNNDSKDTKYFKSYYIPNDIRAAHIIEIKKKL